jgi:YVTN family beta-propeller protein
MEGCGKISWTVNVGVNPAGIAITPRGRYVYVANNNNYSIPGQDSVTVIDLKTKMAIKTISDASFNQPYTITINDKGTKAYVSNSGGSTITVIDIGTDTILDTIDGFDGPSGMVINGSTGYVNNYGATPGVGSGNGKTVSVVDLNTNKIVGDPIVVGLAPAAITITSDCKYVYTANYVDGNPNTGTLTKISTRNNKVVGTLGPFEDGFSGPFNIVLNRRNSKAYVTNFGSNNFLPFGRTVSVVDLRKNTICKQIVVGIQPSGFDIFPNGKYGCVTNYNTLYAYVTPPPVQYQNLTPGQGTVNIIDLDNMKVISTIEVNQSPANVSITPDGKYACVTNYTSNTLNIIQME